MDDYESRLVEAIDSLRTLISASGKTANDARLRSKLEGVELALSYYRDIPKVKPPYVGLEDKTPQEISRMFGER